MSATVFSQEGAQLREFVEQFGHDVMDVFDRHVDACGGRKVFTAAQIASAREACLSELEATLERLFEGMECGEDVDVIYDSAVEYLSSVAISSLRPN